MSQHNNQGHQYARDRNQMGDNQRSQRDGQARQFSTQGPQQGGYSGGYGQGQQGNHDYYGSSNNYGGTGYRDQYGNQAQRLNEDSDVSWREQRSYEGQERPWEGDYHRQDDDRQWMRGGGYGGYTGAAYASGSNFGGYGNYGMRAGRDDYADRGGERWSRNYRGLDRGDSDGRQYRSDQPNWHGGGDRSNAQQHGQQGGRFDPDYEQWRQEQMRSLDDDYHAWRTERYRKFSDEFGEWRKNRSSAISSAQGASAGSDAPATSNSNKKS